VILRERYDSRVRGRAAAIARSLGIPTYAVKQRARALGLCRPRQPWQDWTPEEVAFIEEHAGTRHVHWISQQLARSLTSVILKLKRLHISRRVREGYTQRQVEECLGMDHRRIQQLVESGQLRAAHHSGQPRERWVFTDRALLDFVRRYPASFRLDRVDQLWFLDLVFRGRIGETARQEAA